MQVFTQKKGCGVQFAKRPIAELHVHAGGGTSGRETLLK